MLPEKTSQEVTHPKIAPSQVRLTLEFSGFGIPKSYVHIDDMGSTIKPFDVLSTLKYRGVTITPLLRTQRPRCDISRISPPLGDCPWLSSPQAQLVVAGLL